MRRAPSPRPAARPAGGRARPAPGRPPRPPPGRRASAPVPAGGLAAPRAPAAIRPRESAQPVWVDDFFLAAHEVTLSEYLEFVNAAPPAERVARLPAREQIRLGAAGRYEPAEP